MNVRIPHGMQEVRVRLLVAKPRSEILFDRTFTASGHPCLALTVQQRIRRSKIADSGP